MLFKKTAKKGDHLIEKEGIDRIMHINYETVAKIPSIEDDPTMMVEIIEKLAQTQDVERIVYHQRKKYEYGFKQVQILIEIATIYNHFIKQRKIFSRLALTGASQETIQNLQYLVMNLLKSDPIGCYVESRRFLRDEKIFTGDVPEMLQELHDLLENTKLIKLADNYLDGFSIGDRSVYRAIFKSVITPDFMHTRMMAIPPIEALEVDSYQVSKNTYVQIYDQPTTIKKLYHLIPPEFQISEDKYELIELARKVLAEHKPKAEEFLDTERMRQTFFNIGRDLLIELADNKGVSLKFEEIEELAEIIVRYTVGFGLIEVLLQDPNVQDIVVNSPVGGNPIFLVHSVHDECVTNLIPSVEDVEGWATKFRLVSARPLDEANPILDTEMEIPGARARVAAIGKPLNPYGISYAIRRHRDKPWTLALFIKNGMINSLAAGVLSFLIDGSRTMLIAGTRSSGKSSLLGSVMVEIMRKHRIISIEDTLELPTSALSDLGFNIQPMKVRSALLKSGSEVAADEGIRTSLRLGDSALIVGEVRSVEALAMFEAMRVGALANVVAGTIHGDSPYGVFDRLVNDLKVPRTSFKAIDIMVIANPIKSADGLYRKRRVVSITEVRKHWEKDPLREGAFVDLFKYDPETDELVPTDALLNGDSEIIKSIGGNVKEFAGSWDAIWENIILRSKIKDLQLEYSKGFPNLLEAESTVFLNDEFHRISARVKREMGYLDSKRILFDWEESLKKFIKKEFQS